MFPKLSSTIQSLDSPTHATNPRTMRLLSGGMASAITRPMVVAQLWERLVVTYTYNSRNG